MSGADDILDIVRTAPPATTGGGSSNSGADHILETIGAGADDKKAPAEQSSWQAVNSFLEPSKQLSAGLVQGVANVPYNLWKLAERLQPKQNKSPLGQLRYEMKGSPLTPHQFTFATENDAGKRLPIVGVTPARLGEIVGGFAAPVRGASVIPEITTASFAAKSPAIAAGINSILPSAAVNVVGDAGNPRSNLAESAVLGGLTGGVTGSVVSKVLPALLTSSKSPLNIVSEVKPAVNDMVNEIKGQLSSSTKADNIPAELFGRAKALYQRQQKMIGDAYDSFMQGAEASGLPYKNAGVRESIEDIINPLSEKINKIGSDNPLAKKLENDYQSIASYLPRKPSVENGLSSVKSKIASSAGGKYLKEYQKFLDDPTVGQELNTYQDAKLAKETLNQHINQAKLDENYDLARNLTKVKNSIHESIQNSVAEHPQLQGGLKEIDKAYAHLQEKFMGAPGDESAFHDLYHSQSPDTDKFLSSYIQPGKSADQAIKVDKLMQMLPDKGSKDLAASWWVKDAANPKQFLDRVGQLGERQRNSLFNDRSVAFKIKTLEALRAKHPDVFKEEIPQNATADIANKLVKGGLLLGGAHEYIGGNLPLAALLLAHPAMKAAAPAIATKQMINKFISGGLTPSSIPSLSGRALSAALPQLWSSIRGEQ